MASTRSEASGNRRNFPCRWTGPNESPISVSRNSCAGVRKTNGMRASAEAIALPTICSLKYPLIASSSGISGIQQAYRSKPRLSRPTCAIVDAAERACVASAVDLARSRSIGLVGAGRLGSALAAGLLAEGYRGSGVCRPDGKSPRARAQALAPPVQLAGSPAELARHCDLVFLTVPDREIQSVAEAVPWE